MGNYLNQVAPEPCITCWLVPADLDQPVAPRRMAASRGGTPPPPPCKKSTVRVYGLFLFPHAGALLDNYSKYLASEAFIRMVSGKKSTFSILVRTACVRLLVQCAVGVDQAGCCPCK